MLLSQTKRIIAFHCGSIIFIHLSSILSCFALPWEVP